MIPKILAREPLVKSVDKHLPEVLADDDLAKRPSLLHPNDKPKSKFAKAMNRFYPQTGTENAGLYS